MTIKQFREATKALPDTAQICYHGYDKGCCLLPYDKSELWIFEGQAVVINPGNDYDPRKPNRELSGKKTALLPA
jgi:hypothetical protein